jgi:hypothetical protein
LRIGEYPFSAGRRSLESISESIAELAVDHEVTDIEKFVTRVERVRGYELIETIYER